MSGMSYIVSCNLLMSLNYEEHGKMGCMTLMSCYTYVVHCFDGWAHIGNDNRRLT